AKAQYMHPHETAARRQELARGQEPRAVILTCADSRVPPEIVFDQGLGDIFTIRVAGNIAPDAEVASIEDAFEHLHTPLVVALGPRSAGAGSNSLRSVTFPEQAEAYPGMTAPPPRAVYSCVCDCEAPDTGPGARAPADFRVAPGAARVRGGGARFDHCRMRAFARGKQPGCKARGPRHERAHGTPTQAQSPDPREEPVPAPARL